MINKRLCNFIFVILLLPFLFLETGCCKQKYSYYIWKRRGEEALLAKNYKKAQNYYSLIYNNESSSNNVDKARTTWAFYRLGVIAEVTGDLKMAKGYYWGDAIDDSFYEGEKLTGWFAEAGWKQIDEKNTPRTLEDILQFEKTEPPSDNNEEDKVFERKKDIIVTKKRAPRVNWTNNTGIITRKFSRSVSRPPSNSPEPFKIQY